MHEIYRIYNATSTEAVMTLHGARHQRHTVHSTQQQLEKALGDMIKLKMLAGKGKRPVNRKKQHDLLHDRLIDTNQMFSRRGDGQVRHVRWQCGVANRQLAFAEQ